MEEIQEKISAHERPSYLMGVSTEIRPLLDIYDRLRQILEKETDVDISVIAVIGGQSMGKSSILERLSGVELPRGKGMVTRCALEIQMVNSLSHRVTIKCSDESEAREIPTENVSKEIESITDRIAPKSHINFEKAIYLRVESLKSPILQSWICLVFAIITTQEADENYWET